jgi:hypothetical protein
MREEVRPKASHIAMRSVEPTAFALGQGRSPLKFCLHVLIAFGGPDARGIDAERFVVGARDIEGKAVLVESAIFRFVNASKSGSFLK